MDGLNDLEAEAQRKRRSNRRSEITPPPRRPKTTGQQEPVHEQAGTPVSRHTGVPVHPLTGKAQPQKQGGPREPERGNGQPAKAEKKPAGRTRPPSVEAYLTDELVDWLWQVRAAGVAHRKDNVTSAVVRLALEELRARMNPEQIIAALDEAPQSEPRTARGRRR